MIKKFLYSTLAVLLPATASAIIACPDPIEITQPDGSTLTVLIKGDEYHHIYTTEDGLLLSVDADGFFRYAGLADNNSIEAAGPVARNISARNAEECAFISTMANEKLLLRAGELRSQNLERRKPLLMKRNLMNSTRSDEAPERGLGLVSKFFPGYGEPRACIILVEYQDVRFGVKNAGEYYTRMLNSENFTDYGATGSARQYFIDNSNGIFRPRFDVYGPVLLDEDRAYYGGNNSWGDDRYAQGMIIEACEKLDNTVDFSVYDHDGDGFVDNVFVFYAGGGAHDGGGGPDAVWPHASHLTALEETPFIHDGVQLDSYGCTCETPKGYERPDGIGTFVHEFSHVIGLPDLYSTIYNTAYTPGKYSCLDSGPYNNEGRTPPNYSSFERTALGWMKATPFGAPGDYELPELSTSNFAYIIPSDQPEEYLLFENRQHVGNDRFIPGHGMIVWRIDYKGNIWELNSVNNNPRRQRVDLIEADGVKDNENDRSGHPFPGSANITSFGYNTTPALNFVNKTETRIELTGIEEVDGTIRFTYINPDYVDNAVEEITGEAGSAFSVDGLTIHAVKAVEVYTISGLHILSVPGGGSATLPSGGLYIIVHDNKAVKLSL